MLRSSWLTTVYRRLSSRPTGRSRRNRYLPTSSAVCRVERLESRVLLSAAPAGTETLVNTTTTNDQTTNDTGQAGSIAMDAAGDYVVTWTSSGQDGGGKGETGTDLHEQEQRVGDQGADASGSPVGPPPGGRRRGQTR